MAHQDEPFPIRDPVVEEKERTITRPWVRWLLALAQHVNDSPHQLNAAREQARAASTPTTTLLAVSADRPGLYLVRYYARISRPGTTSSFLRVTIGWTDGGVVQSLPGAGISGNQTTTVKPESFLIRADQSSNITYSTSYQSTGATVMQYELDVIVDQVLGP